ncbi:hypothetical protein BCR33DRAFT_857404 [Rhizoclosmatium globosum]|uniref:Myb/SANT-like domain-containing protein n=1 Tax=Rhizoclosmatium globosum TaxID=329046 RepID=A0A1Y2B665_9FUNG|nr:hypothetical protein BCR33DRAFT_857404 [Rhizoclosmatium globosum]|eukprot:ORY30323.1 hypothetical protein BCR33DRAFT_857404 [Rhizoclosmatium globosum]
MMAPKSTLQPPTEPLPGFPTMKPPSPLKRKRSKGHGRKSATKAQTRTFTTPGEFAAMINWLEIASNFKIVVGGAAKDAKMKSGQLLKKVDGLKQLMNHVNATCCSGWDAKTVKNRYDGWITRYKKTKKEAQATGFGLTNNDEEKEIRTIEEKLECMCPQYVRLDRLFGERFNDKPLATTEVGIVVDKDGEKGKEVDGEVEEDAESCENSESDEGAEDVEDSGDEENGENSEDGNEDTEFESCDEDQDEVVLVGATRGTVRGVKEAITPQATQDEAELFSVDKNDSEYNDYEYDPIPSPTRKKRQVPPKSKATKSTLSKAKLSAKSPISDTQIKASITASLSSSSKKMDFSTVFNYAQAAKNEILQKAISEKAAVKHEKLRFEETKWREERDDKKAVLALKSEQQKKELEMTEKRQFFDMAMALSKEAGISFGDAAKAIRDGLF